MSDLRESILARLVEVIEAVDGIAFTARNVILIDETDLPAAFVLDGIEEAVVEDQDRRRSAGGPVRVIMTPQVHIRTRAADPDDTGPALSALRAAVIKAVLGGATLAGIVYPNGSLQYAGCSNEIAAGRQHEAAISVSFAIRYVLAPALL